MPNLFLWMVSHPIHYNFVGDEENFKNFDVTDTGRNTICVKLVLIGRLGS